MVVAETPVAGGGQRQASGGGGQRQQDSGGGQRQAERRAEPRNGNGRGRRESAGAAPESAPESRPAPQARQATRDDSNPSTVSSPSLVVNLSRAKPRHPLRIRAVKSQASAWHASVGQHRNGAVQPRVAVPRQPARAPTATGIGVTTGTGTATGIEAATARTHRVPKLLQLLQLLPTTVLLLSVRLRLRTARSRLPVPRPLLQLVWVLPAHGHPLRQLR